MRVRPATEDDISDIINLTSRIKEEYFERNNIPQWQGNYPSEEMFVKDLSAGRLFVMYMGECLIGFASMEVANDPNYEKIENGSWLSNSPYVVVHRFGINPDWHRMGMGSALIALADKLAEAREVKSIKCDTHEANLGMIGLLTKAGFTRCGIIHIEDGSPRAAFEKII